MRTFKELKDIIAHGKGNIDLTTNANAELLTDIEFAINNIQEECNKDIAIRKLFIRKGRFLTEAKVTTGTVSLTKGSKTATFSSAILTADFKDRIFISDDDTSVAYRIASVTSSTAAKLDAAYAGDTNATATFTILKDRYYLGREVLGVWNVVDRSNENPIKLQNKTGLSDPDLFDVDTDSEPEDGAIILSLETFYDVGTVAVTKDSKDITIATGSFISAMDGMPIRIDGDSVDYTFNYTDATNGTLDRNYEGTTNAAATYKMSPPGQWVAQLYEYPTTQILIDYDYLLKLPRLVNDNDISLITVLNDNVLWHGAKWFLKDDEGTDPNGANESYQLYQKSKAEMALGIGRLLPQVSQYKYKDI